MKLKYFVSLISISGISILYSCTKMDHEYAPYLKSGEIIYVGAPYNLEAHPGRGRVEIQFTQSKDPNITRYIIYWNDRKNQQTIPADKNSLIQKVIITGLAEGNYPFEIVSLDKAGNTSTPGSAIINGESLGSQYESNLIVRTLTTTNSQKGLILNLVSTDTTCISTTVQYLDVNGHTRQRSYPQNAALSDTLTDIAPTCSALGIKSAYVPYQGIDTFYATSNFHVNLALGDYICTGTMIDYTNSSLTGAYPWNVTLQPSTVGQMELVDDDYTGGVYHWIKSGGGNSYYGQFGVVINLDSANNVISVINKYGQPSSNGRSGELDPSGVNKFDPVTKVLKVKYWMNQNGGHRTSFDEVMTMD